MQTEARETPSVHHCVDTQFTVTLTAGVEAHTHLSSPIEPNMFWTVGESEYLDIIWGRGWKMWTLDLPPHSELSLVSSPGTLTWTFSCVRTLHSLYNQTALALCLGVLQGEIWPGAAANTLQEAKQPLKNRREEEKNGPAWSVSVCGPFSRWAMLRGNCQPAGRQLNPREWSRRWRRRRRQPGAFFSADTLIESRGSHEMKAARSWKSEKGRLR